MPVIEDLEEDEAYLYAILTDPSGLDLAEFSWTEPDPTVSADGCWRAWPFQWAWYRCQDNLQIDQCARSVGKTMSITVRAFAFPFLYPGQEMVITAPELVHLEPLTQLVERRFQDTRLGREVSPSGRSAVTHRPFMMRFLNGSRIIGRIPQKDGKGVKGIHPVWLELDEAQDYPEAGWVELVETLKRGHEGAVWRAHGVTRGVRDKFYEYTQPESKWTVHRFTAMSRPNWTDEERQEKIEMYGSRDAPDYRRNVAGLHGDAANPLFVLHRLMACVDDDLSSAYNMAEYQHIRVTHEMLVDRGIERDVTEFLDFPQMHKKYKVTWAGMDVGYTNHPSEIIIAGEERSSASGERKLRVIARLHLERLSAPVQAKVIKAVFDFYSPETFGMDRTGNGLPLFQVLQDAYPDIAARIKGYNFSEKILVDFDQAAVAEMKDDAELDDQIKEAGVHKQVLEYATDKLRELVDTKALILPWDTSLIGEFQGQTWSYSKEAMDMYGRRRRVYSQGSFHALDASRMMALGFAQHTLEEMIEAARRKDDAPVFDSFVSF